MTLVQVRDAGRKVLFKISQKAKKKLHACVFSYLSLPDHYSEFITNVVALKFATTITKPLQQLNIT